MINKIKNWEQWPFNVLYAPIAPMWIWYIIRSRSFWFFTPSNPKLTFGGLEGEPKKEMHELLPANMCPVHFNVTPGEDFNEVLNRIPSLNLQFPLIVKPEIGEQGVLFRKIDNEAHLKEYHQKMPVEYIVQEFVKYPLEVSIFYYRYPFMQSGAITGFLQKVPLHVIGDGKSTLESLILQNGKSKKRIDELKPKYAARFQEIIPAGEKFVLSHAGNHNRGAQFIDLSREINEELVQMLDKISIGINDFYYGRYDIMCQSIEDLKKGSNFAILEYNGCGAEPNHFYDTGYTLIGAWKEILKHWKILFKISRYNHSQGVHYWSFSSGMNHLKNARKNFKRLQTIDQSIS